MELMDYWSTSLSVACLPAAPKAADHNAPAPYARFLWLEHVGTTVYLPVLLLAGVFNLRRGFIAPSKSFITTYHFLLSF
jgi:hypothetical protein